MAKNLVMCGKCGKFEDYNRAIKNGWLISNRANNPIPLVRCPDHITDYARRMAGQKQMYYRLHKPTK